jgi:MarR family transcriptional regulator, organic hydroperoxide resistance regulator
VSKVQSKPARPGQNEERLQLSNQLCFATYSAAHAFNKVYKPLLDRLGVTYPQFLVLLVLWDRDRLTVTEIGRHLFLDSGTLTPLLKRLEAAGHVSRHRDAADERRVVVEPTDQGWALRDEVAGVPLELMASLDISEREAATLRRTLGKLIEHLDA